MFMTNLTNQQPPKLAEPGVGSFHDPAALITPQFAPIFVAPFLIVLPGKARSVQCLAFSAAPAAGQNRSRGRRLRVPASEVLAHLKALENLGLRNQLTFMYGKENVSIHARVQRRPRGQWASS